MNDEDRSAISIEDLAREALFKPRINRIWDIAQSMSTADLFKRGAGALDAVDSVLREAWAATPRTTYSQCPGFSSVANMYFRISLESGSPRLGRWLKEMPPDFQDEVLRTTWGRWVGRLIKAAMPGDLYAAIEEVSLSGEEKVRVLASELLRKLPEHARPESYRKTGRGSKCARS